MKIHPAAEIFPAMSEDEFERLADSIEMDGLVEPIMLLDGAILDGRHRQQACDQRGVSPLYEEWDSACGITPLEWVIAKNVHRRQLTTAQKAAVAVEVEERLAASARERMKEGGRRAGRGRPIGVGHLAPPYSRGPRSRDIAAEQFGIGSRTVSRAKEILARDRVVFDRLKAGEITVPVAQSLVGLSEKRTPRKRTRQSLRDALAPLRSYLKNWNEERLYGMEPKEARKLLKQVQEVDSVLLEVERALEARTVLSRALR